VAKALKVKIDDLFFFEDGTQEAEPRQIDVLGGADPLTSKVAIIARSGRADADVKALTVDAQLTMTVEIGAKA
jgi:2-methylaconitate cis-trans-isomerase PrpF